MYFSDYELEMLVKDRVDSCLKAAQAGAIRRSLAYDEAATVRAPRRERFARAALAPVRLFTAKGR